MDKVQNANLCRFCDKSAVLLVPQLEIYSRYCEYHGWRAENGDYDDY